MIRVSILGAESTGKTQLVQALARALRTQGQTVHVVPEYLRQWCDEHARTPQAHEQMAIAQHQAQAVLQFTGGIVLADTTPLMTAIYSHYIFQDSSLYAMALAHQQLYDMNLLTGLDLPWVADGLQRDGPQAREAVDAMLRQALQQAPLSHKVIYGQGDERVHNALLALGWASGWESADAAEGTLRVRQDSQYGLNRGRTAWVCENCSDADCEHKLFSRLVSG